MLEIQETRLGDRLACGMGLLTVIQCMSHASIYNEESSFEAMKMCGTSNVYNIYKHTDKA